MKHHWQLHLSTILLAGSAGAVSAQDALKEIDFHGFATQSYLYSSENNFFGESSDGSFDFFELGINTLWAPTKKLKLAVQAVARDAGNTDDGSIRLDYGFLEYQLLTTSSSNTGIRVGRVVNPLGFYNESRDVAATRPGTLLPQSIYFDVNRNLALSSDGVFIFYDKFSEQNDLSFQLSIAEPRTRDPDLEPALFGTSRPGSLEGTTSWLGRVLYEHDFGKIRLALTAADLNLEYQPKNDPIIRDGDLSFQPIILSAQYNTEKWELTTEWARRKTELTNLEVLPDWKLAGTSYFLQAAYRISNSLTVQLRYDSLVWDNDDKKGEEFASNPFYPYPGYTRYAKDWTLGLRWDINQHLLISAEVHDIKGTGWLSLLENPNPAAMEKDWRLFAVTASVRF
ncbi:hypothetical protein [Halioxenophilus aromaticivorans]|uniref:DUF3570 domain-containing protein n=1 Tax=Halioxenophilus aromaticivorans TaxID=1306992 RepID=A0AAV3U2B5_9ALTE